MATFRIIETPTGPAVQWGTGASFDFARGDDDSLLAAVIKAVNVGIEAGDDIEGEVAQAIAEVLKAEGAPAWSSDDSYEDFRYEVIEALPKSPMNGMECPYSLKDISLDTSKALVCYYPGEGETQHFVVGLSRGEDGEVALAPQAEWKEVRENVEFVEKAGRVLSQANLQAVEDAISALNAVAERERARNAHEVEEDEETEKAVDDDAEVEYLVVKSATEEEMRYTFGPLYAPSRKDAHGEWVKDTVLQKSQQEYVRESSEAGRRINLQHGDEGEVTVGEWVDIVTWPKEETFTMKSADGTEAEVVLPAGTVYMGVVWDEDAWPLIKSGKLNGYSLGGRAVKVKGGDKKMPSMGFKTPKG